MLESVWEGLGRVCPFQKKRGEEEEEEETLAFSPRQTQGHFLLAHRGGNEVLIDVGIAGKEPLMLMRILFGCH